MSVHPNGLGITWDEDLDVDQPQGLDYRSWNHLAKSVRKRIEKQHTDFGDDTIGGEHLPGKTSVLMVDTTANFTTYLGSFCMAEFGLGYVVATGKLYYVNDATTDITLVMLNPSSLCSDVSLIWNAEAEFSAPVLFDDTVTFLDPVDMSDVVVAGSLCVAGGAYFDASMDVSGSFEHDGTGNFNDAVDISTIRIINIAEITGHLSVFGDVSLADISGAARQRLPTAWASFCGDGIPPANCTIKDSYNVNVIYKTETGAYEVSFATALADANYVVIPSIRNQWDPGDIAITSNCIGTTTFRLCSRVVSVGIADASGVRFVIFGGN